MLIFGLQIHNTYTTHVKKCVLLCVVLGSSLVNTDAIVKFCIARMAANLDVVEEAKGFKIQNKGHQNEPLIDATVRSPTNSLGTDHI